MKKKIIIISCISILVVILLAVSLYFYGLTSRSQNNDNVAFVVNKGESTKQIINNLYEAKLIRSKLSALIYVKLHKISVQAGNYELKESLNVQDIFDILTNGKVKKETVKITFIEGKRLVDFEEQLEEKLGITESAFLDTINDKEYLQELINKYSFLDDSILNDQIYYSLEGYLFPATYEFYKKASVKDVIERMLKKTGDVLAEYETLIKESKYNVHEILTMASIIENETKYQSDRPLVSQVIYKRLDTNMSLGMDVTAYYGARKKLTDPITSVDLNAENAYNTRNTAFKGLPVGPICNPSEDSIKAALEPSDSNYVYFYADKGGKLHFATTYSEFQELKKTYS